MEFLILTILIYIIVSLYVIFNLVRRNEKLEQMYLDSVDTYYKSIEQIQNTIDLMNTIDSRGAFQSDDEVGTGFKMLKDTITDLSNSLNTLNQYVNNE